VSAADDAARYRALRALVAPDPQRGAADGGGALRAFAAAAARRRRRLLTIAAHPAALGAFDAPLPLTEPFPPEGQ